MKIKRLKSGKGRKKKGWFEWKGEKIKESEKKKKMGNWVFGSSFLRVFLF